MSMIRVMVVACALLVAPAGATTYYVDSVGGVDANGGTTTNTAWKTLTKVNGTTFQPGDSILFKAGGVWTGTTQLYPKGSGAANNPIVIDKYGTGPLPVIDAGNATGGGAVRLVNQQYWEINNLEITSDATSDGDRRGVHLSASSGGTFSHLYVRNCYVHDIRGKAGTSDSDLSAKRTGGIVVEGTSSAAKWDDILLEGNTIYAVTNQGIVAVINGNGGSSLNNYYPGTTSWSNVLATRVVIRNNSISGVYKNGMIIRNTDESGLVEHNVLHDTAVGTTGNTIFTSSCRGTVFQYNEGYRNLAGDHDGSLYDSDLRSPGIVFQYSYSHDNSHGLFWTYPNSSSEPNNNVVVRYNISQNDQGDIFAFSGTGDSSSSYIYNNTVYISSTNPPPSNPPQNIFEDRASGHTYYVYNNVFVISNSTAVYSFSGSTHVFDYNLFYGYHGAGEPGDAHKLTSNPRLVSCGSGGLGMDSLDGYQLQSSSPCIDSGKAVANNGGQDLWGNTVPFNGVTDRGANEYTPSVALPGITNQAPALTRSNVTFNALLNPNGAATTWYYQYGLSASYGSFGSTNTLAAGTGAVAVSNVVAGLLPGTLYHYRLVASNSVGVSTGADATLTTLAVAPIATTQPATGIDAGAATLNGAADPGGAITACYFQYGLTTNYGSFTATNSVAAGTSPVGVSKGIGGLLPGTPYHCRLVATNSAGSSVGADLTFTTLPTAPTVVSQSFAEATATGVRLNAAINPGGAVTTCYFQYGTSTNYGQVSVTNTLPSGTASLAVSNAITGLLPGTQYHFSVVASNGVGATAGADIVFTTLAAMPTTLTQPATGVGTHSANLNATVDPGGAATTWQFEYGTTTNYGLVTTTSTVPAGNGASPVGLGVSNLLSGTVYHYRIVATNSVGSSNGTDAMFTTVAVIPPLLIAPAFLPDGAFQFAFTNSEGVGFTVWAATDPSLPSTNWDGLGAPTAIGGGLYQFTDSGATNCLQRFYQLREP
jgi:hypothetical protein